MFKSPTQKPKTLQARILSGSFVLLSGSGLATAINLSYNIAVARYLGPQGFGNATAVYTLLTLISAVTLSFQIVSAKVVAQQKSLEGKSAGYRSLHGGAWACGILLALLMLLFQRAITDYLNLPSPVLVVLLAIGVVFYVPLGSRRGYLQGAYGFRRLATNLVLEGAVRLGGSLLLILLGLGVPGVIAANSAAVAVAYFAITPKLAARIPNPLRLPYALREMSQAMVFFSGQVLINNCDIVLVKHFFLSEAAGLYAAVAMVGRVIFSISQAVVNSMFPLVAGTREEERKDLTVIATSLFLVLSIGSALAIGLRLAPAWIWTALFGAKFAIAGKYGLPYLLALYAITTVVYSLSAVIITYEMSYKIANTSWIQLAFSGIVIAGICLFHSSLRQVILVQLVLMTVLLILVALPFLIDLLTNVYKVPQSGVFRPVRAIRHVTENEVVAEFLKSDCNNPAFREYQEALRKIVLAPDLDDADENAKRRALFFMQHLALWRELPAGTEWYEVEVKEENLDQIRAFPRAQWRKIAQGNFSMTGIAECLRTGQNALDRRFLAKIAEIQDRLQEDTDLGSVVLIGMNESGPLTVLDGNHRLVAAMLASPSRVHRLRFLCGLSPRMTECCWYNTNFATLFRYGRNVLWHVVRRPNAGLGRLFAKSWIAETRE
ncbi:MAG: lipopolysaccharide biosynthesis protein [Acidobacteriaceae bacterium]